MFTKKITIDWIIENYMDYFMKFQMTEENIRNHFEEWKAGKQVVFLGDYLWYIFQLIVKTIAKHSGSEEQMYRLNVEIYSKMWEFMVKVENRKANHVLKSKFQNQFRLWQLESKFKQVVEIISGHCCPYCNSLDGKKISIEEAMENQYLASKECTRKWGCNCCYAPTFERDEKGNLIPLSP